MDNNALLLPIMEFVPTSRGSKRGTRAALRGAPLSILAATEDIMTKRSLSILSAMTLVTVLSPLAVWLGAAEVTCQIPFAFTVNDTPLPAGHYTVSTRDNALLISGLTRSAIVLGQRTESRTRTTPKLVFDKLGDHYTLREVWMDERSGREFPKSRGYEDRRLAASQGKVERLVIAAR